MHVDIPCSLITIVWMSGLSFIAVKNTISLTLINPVANGLAHLGRPHPHWLPLCRRLTKQYYQARQRILNHPVPQRITDYDSEIIGSRALAWTSISASSMGTTVALVLRALRGSCWARRTDRS